MQFKADSTPAQNSAMLFYNATFSLDFFLYIRLAMTSICILLDTMHLKKKQGEKVVLLITHLPGLGAFTLLTHFSLEFLHGDRLWRGRRKSLSPSKIKLLTWGNLTSTGHGVVRRWIDERTVWLQLDGSNRKPDWRACALGVGGWLDEDGDAALCVSCLFSMTAPAVLRNHLSSSLW